MAQEPPKPTASPAERIAARLQELAWSPSDLAWALGYSLSFTERMLERPVITPQLALRLEAAFQDPAETWADVQRDHDLARLRDRMGGELARIRRRAAHPRLSDFP
jgi:plasmid maintenance system antidote protein VapI